MTDEIIKQENKTKTAETRKKSNVKNNISVTRPEEYVGETQTINKISAMDDNVKDKNIRLSLADIANLVNAVVDTVFVERDGNIEFAAEYYEVIRAYWSIRYFYPHLITDDMGIFEFFEKYISGDYNKELSDLEHNIYWQYADNAIFYKIKIKEKQVENPVTNSITKFFNAAGILAEKYVNDIDKIGTDDLKGFLENFGKLAQNTNADKVAQAVFEKQTKQEKFAKNKEKSKKGEQV